MIHLIACSICLRVRRGPEWLDAEHVIRDILVVRRVLAEAVLADGEQLVATARRPESLADFVEDRAERPPSSARGRRSHQLLIPTVEV